MISLDLMPQKVTIRPWVKNIEGTEKYSEHKKIINYLHS
jgi:hypothetical protein